MTCPCHSGKPGRLGPQGEWYCDDCKRTRRLHGKGPATEVELSRDVITRRARARRRIEEMRDEG